jgi:hypothetical protein
LAGARKGEEKVSLSGKSEGITVTGEKKKEGEKQRDLPRISTAEGCQCRIFIGVSLHASGFNLANSIMSLVLFQQNSHYNFSVSAALQAETKVRALR